MNSEYSSSGTRIDRIAPTEERGSDDDVYILDLRAYLTQVMSGLRAAVVTHHTRPDPVIVAAEVIDLLFSRAFSYLGRARARMYEDAIKDVIVRAVERAEPIPFYFDIGGGYHATISPGQQDLSFAAGLGELFVISQIARLRQAIAQVYAPGIHFSLVIDNLCALLVNDIPLAKTREYCMRLRRLVDELRLTDIISVLLESEHFSSADLAHASLAEPPAEIMPMTAQRHQNVERFLGRPCAAEEALEREARYHVIVSASERLLNRLIDGIHMTQRASSKTMCFRPFPGGDSRIQSGQVVMTLNSSGTLLPMLLTSANVARYSCSTYRFAELLPREIEHVILAHPVGTPEPIETRPKFQTQL